MITALEVPPQSSEYALLLQQMYDESLVTWEQFREIAGVDLPPSSGIDVRLYEAWTGNRVRYEVTDDEGAVYREQELDGSEDHPRGAAPSARR
jgi:hypothetical protein